MCMCAGATACVICPPGKFGSLPGLSTCPSSCVAGRYTPGYITPCQVWVRMTPCGCLWLCRARERERGADRHRVRSRQRLKTWEGVPLYPALTVLSATLIDIDQDCPPGTFSAAAAGSCTPCAAGKFSSTLNTSSCTPCQGGQYTNVTGQIACVVCPPGTYTAGGAAPCTPCAAGDYASTSGVCRRPLLICTPRFLGPSP